MRNFLWHGKPWQAFKTFAILFSFGMNLILLIVLLLLAPNVLSLVHGVGKPLVVGLNDSFVEMSGATIVRTIEVQDVMPIAFTLPLETTTDVKVIRDVPLAGVPARFVLPGGGGEINGQVFLALPAGLELPVQFSLEVPVDQQIPIALAVDAEIPLAETELGAPFMRLQGLFAPLARWMNQLPADNGDFYRRLVETPATLVNDPASD